MSYKTILFDVSGSRHTAQNLDIAIDLTRRFQAHLIGSAGTCLPPSFYMPEMIGGAAEQAAIYLDYVRERAKTNLAYFDACAEKAGLSAFESRLINEEQDLALVAQAPYADLIIMGQPDPDEALSMRRNDFAEYVITHAGRPVLLIPYAGNFPQLGNNVLIAWDGGAMAARAVCAAIPMLRQAKQVQVAAFRVAGKSRRHEGQLGADIAVYLARHQIHVEVIDRVIDSDTEIGNALLSQAADGNNDLLVMGAYGHARLREILLGGVTATVLKSMTLPTLVMH